MIFIFWILLVPMVIGTLLTLWATGVFTKSPKPKPATPCSGHGKFDSEGKCICLPEWIGKTCETEACNGNGKIVKGGECECIGNWTGQFCSNNICENGGEYNSETTVCKCTSEWEGKYCDEKVLVCSGHGTLDPMNKTCVCAPGYWGVYCANPI